MTNFNLGNSATSDILNDILYRNKQQSQQGALGVNTNFAPQLLSQPSVSNIGSQLYTSNMPAATAAANSNSQNQAALNNQLLLANRSAGLLQPIQTSQDYGWGNAAADILGAVMQRNASRGGS